MQHNDWLHVNIGGVDIRFRSDLEEERNALAGTFRYHTVDTTPETAHRVTFEGTERRCVPGDARLVWKGVYHAVGHRGAHDNDLMKYVSPDGQTEYYETADGECVVTDLRTMHTRCMLRERRKFASRKRERAQIGSLLIPMLHVVMAYHDRYSLHAAAVEWKGRAVLFTGRSGQGKSTLSTDLAALGTGFLGDDIVFLYRDGVQTRIASLLFEAKLFESSKKTKDFVDILARHGGKPIQSLPLGAVCEVRQTAEGPTDIIPAADEEALFQIILRAANNVAMQYNRGEWLATFGSVVSGYRLHTVNFGDRSLLDTKFLDRLAETYPEA